MTPVAIFLLSVASIFLLGALGEVVFRRTNIPDVIWLILAGIALGPVGGLVTRERLDFVAPYFAALTLVVVLFEGGSKLELDELFRAAPRSSILAGSSFVLAAALVAVVSMGAAAVGWLPASWTWVHGAMLGTILGGSSSIIIMPAMAQAKLDAKIANLVNIESALTDALCVVGTSALVDVALKGTGGASAPALSLAKSFGIGLAIGAVAGVVWLIVLRFLRSSEHAYPVTLSGLLALYVLIDRAGGSAALGILTVAVLLGNAPRVSKKIGLEAVELDHEVRGFHQQMAFMIKSFFFVFIGAMLGPPWSAIGLGVLLGAVLFASRIPAVYLSMLGRGFDDAERRLVIVALPRGMAAGVLATMPRTAGVPGTEDLPVAVFACVLVTILVFAAGFPLARRAMKPAAPVAAPPGEPQPAAPPAPPGVLQPAAPAAAVLAFAATGYDAAPAGASPGAAAPAGSPETGGEAAAGTAPPAGPGGASGTPPDGGGA